MSNFTLATVVGFLLALLLSDISRISNAAKPSARRTSACYALLVTVKMVGAEGVRIGLSVEPPDLTTLRRRNGGVFPRDRLRRIIDGREEIKIHGDREMPVWGQLFKLDAEQGLGGAEGDEPTVERRIEALIDFIDLLQN